MSRYAERTDVSAIRTRGDIEQLLRGAGATSFGYAWEDGREQLAFRLGGRQVRISVPMPDRNDPTICRTPTGKPRSANAAQEAFEAEVRRRWRSVLLVIKAKLVGIADGVTTLEREFLADMVTEDGRTVGEVIEAGDVRPFELTAGGAR